MKTQNKSSHKKNTYVKCDNCGMQPVCQPVKAGRSKITLTDSYLSRRNVIANTLALFTEQEPLSSIYAVCSGSFKLTETKDDGSEKVIGFRFPGELVGEDAIHKQAYCYNAIAVGNASVCQVDINELLACGSKLPDLQLNLIKLLSKQNAMLRNEFTTVVAKHSAESLLASFLLNIIERNAQYQGSATMIHLPVGRDIIANHLGFRRETLSRIFSKFQQNNWVSIHAKNIEIVDMAALKQLAHN